MYGGGYTDWYDMDDVGYGATAGSIIGVVGSLLLEQGQPAKLFKSSECEDMGCGCNCRSCCCSPPGTELMRLITKHLAFVVGLLSFFMTILGFVSYKCDGPYPSAIVSDVGESSPSSFWDDDRVASHLKHSQGHLHLNRDATRRGHCLSLDAEIAWFAKGVTTSGAAAPASFAVERHSSAHAMFGLAQWVPGYGEAVQPVVPADGCHTITTTFPKGGVALVER
eukprot:gene23531-25257_t